MECLAKIVLTVALVLKRLWGHSCTHGSCVISHTHTHTHKRKFFFCAWKVVLRS